MRFPFRKKQESSNESYRVLKRNHLIVTTILLVGIIILSLYVYGSYLYHLYTR